MRRKAPRRRNNTSYARCAVAQTQLQNATCVNADAVGDVSSRQHSRKVSGGASGAGENRLTTVTASCRRMSGWPRAPRRLRLVAVTTPYPNNTSLAEDATDPTHLQSVTIVVSGAADNVCLGRCSTRTSGGAVRVVGVIHPERKMVSVCCRPQPGRPRAPWR